MKGEEKAKNINRQTFSKEYLPEMAGILSIPRGELTHSGEGCELFFDLLH